MDCSSQAEVLAVMLQSWKGWVGKAQVGKFRVRVSPAGHSSEVAEVTFPWPVPVVQQLMVRLCWLGDAGEAASWSGKREAARED